MIIFRKVRWRNLFSYGNMFTEIQLDRSPSTMILGKNGSGKSAFTDALVFGLFGKPFRKIKKDQMINTKNGKDALVEVEFDIDKDQYLIRRGIKPGIFEIWKNGEILNQPGSSRDYQKFLETTILKMDYEAACQIVFVGAAQHTTFMQLDTSKRRKFVEVILNLVVFSNMSKIHYNKTYELKNRLSELKSAVTVAKEKVKIRQRYIDDLKSAEKQTQEEELARVRIELEDISARLIDLYEDRNNITSDIDPVDRNAYQKAMNDLRDHLNLVSSLDSKISDLNKNLQKLGDAPECYACHQAIDPEEHTRQREHLFAKREAVTSAKTELQIKIPSLQDSISKFDEAIKMYDLYLGRVREVDAEITIAERQKEHLEAELIKERSSQKDKIEAGELELRELEKLYLALNDKWQELQTKSEYMQLIGTMLQDKGIKSMLIKRFIPIINHSVNQHLQQLGLFVKFHLDENFDETIQARGIDTLGYNSYSEGEKLRMDMALLLAWRDIAKLQGNVSTNLLIFDEIFDSSLDTTGAESLADLLGVFQHLNVFIITHTPEKIAEKVRSIIKIERQDGFSKISKWEEKQ